MYSQGIAHAGRADFSIILGGLRIPSGDFFPTWHRPKPRLFPNELLAGPAVRDPHGYLGHQLLRTPFPRNSGSFTDRAQSANANEMAGSLRLVVFARRSRVWYMALAHTRRRQHGSGCTPGFRSPPKYATHHCGRLYAIV